MFPEKLRISQVNRYPPYNFPWYIGATEDPFGTPISEGDILGFFRDPRGILFETQFFVAYMPSPVAMNINENVPKYFQTKVFRDILREYKNPFTKQALLNPQKDILLRRASFQGYDVDPINDYNSNNNNAMATTKSFDSTYSLGSRSSTIANENEELLFPLEENMNGGKRMMHQWFFLHKGKQRKTLRRVRNRRKSHRTQRR